MNWLEITVEANDETVEAISAVFDRYAGDGRGTSGAVVEFSGYDSRGERSAPRVTVRTYVRNDPDAAGVVRDVEQALDELRGAIDCPVPEVRTVDEADWANAWKQHYTPQRIGQHLLIVPGWLAADPSAGDVVIQLDPGMAFGTGTHPTTRLSLVCLEQRLQPGQRVLDVGTGSGILAIAAVRLGAQSVVATDIDPVALTVAAANFAANGVGGSITLLAAPLPATGQFDLIVANILAEAHLALLEDGLVDRLALGGCLILGGIIDTAAAAVAAALAHHGLRLSERLAEGDWVELVAVQA
jgi:ribosomal protein L11 methyltransferase